MVCMLSSSSCSLSDCFTVSLSLSSSFVFFWGDPYCGYGGTGCEDDGDDADGGGHDDGVDGTGDNDDDGCDGDGGGGDGGGGDDGDEWIACNHPVVDG